MMCSWLLTICIFGHLHLYEAETVSFQQVVRGRINYKCDFQISYAGVEVNLKQSKANCKPQKKGKAENIKLISPSGVQFIVNMKFPTRITKASVVEPPTKPSTNPSQSTDRSRTEVAIMQSQGSLLSNLTEDQQNAFWETSLKNGYIADPQCPLKTVMQCNENRKVIKCINEGPTKFTLCVEPFCQFCGCALGSLLGFNCETHIMERFILNTTETMEDFGNILETPFNSNSPSKFTYNLYMNYLGELIPEANSSKLRESLSIHYSYFANKYNWTTSQRQGEDPVSTAKTVIDTADKLVDLIAKVKDIVLGNLEKEIKKINTDVDGITETQRTNMREALTALYTAEVHISKTRAQLESLAEETISRVDTMIYYLSKVQDDWEYDKIVKFLKFQAKKMTEMVERSLTLLKEADKLYTETSLNLADIKARLVAFAICVKDLSDQNSKAYEDRVKAMRKKVYLPCCINPLGWVFCPICAGILETTINAWKDALNSLNTVLDQNQKHTENLKADLDETIKFMQEEIKLIIKWQGALLVVSEIDYTFPEAEIFGFADVRPAVVSSLENLKTAAFNYLNNKKEAN